MMPIGLLIGWLVGQLIAGILIHDKAIAENKIASLNETKRFSVAIALVGTIMMWTALFGLIGTVIELMVR
jgi:hypothetical protein